MRGLLAFVLAQALVSPVPGVQLQDEGTSQGQVTKLNFTGAGVTCSKSGATGTCSIPGGGGGGAGGGGGSANVVNVTVTFNTSTGLVTPVVVTGQTWVTSSSSIVCQWSNLAAVTNNTDYVYLVAGLHVAVGSLVAGTGFTVYAYSDYGATGNFNLSCTGA